VNLRVDDAADAGGSLIGVGLASVEPSDHGIRFVGSPTAVIVSASCIDINVQLHLLIITYTTAAAMWRM
jgi:hypothetical protein